MTWNEIEKEIRKYLVQEKVDRAKQARLNLLTALSVEMKDIPEAIEILKRYKNAHSGRCKST